MGRIPTRHRKAFNKRMRKEAAFEEKAAKTAAKYARRLAAHNPGVIFIGGGKRRIVFPENSDLVEVTLNKNSSVTSGGMKKTNSYTLTKKYADGTVDTTRFTRKTQRMRDRAETAFEDAIPDYDSRPSITLSREILQNAEEYFEEHASADITVPSDLIS